MSDYKDNYNYSGNNLAGGWEFRMDCPECDKFTFISNSSGYIQDREYRRINNDLVDDLNDEELKVDGEYYCPICNNKYKLKFNKKDVDNIDNINGFFMNINNYNRHKKVQKVDNKYYTISDNKNGLVEHDKNLENQDKFIEISEKVYSIDSEKWYKIFNRLEENQKGNIDIGCKVINDNMNRGEIIGIYNDDGISMIQINYKNQDKISEEKKKNINNNIYIINDKIYNIDNDIWNNISKLYYKIKK